MNVPANLDGLTSTLPEKWQWLPSAVNVVFLGAGVLVKHAVTMYGRAGGMNGIRHWLKYGDKQPQQTNETKKES